MSYELTNSVGLNDDSGLCANLALDQQQVAELLMSVPLPFGGLRTSTGPAIIIPSPFLDGAISGELIGAIQTFQTVQKSSLNIDLRVEPGSPTLALLVELAAQAPEPVEQTTVILDAISQSLEETSPIPASGLPSLIYTPKTSEEQLVFESPSVRVTATLSGILTGSWNESIGPACIASPDINSLEQAVSSGNIRQIGATALDQACKEIRAQTRFAANELFSAVSITWDGDGNFRVSGTCGNKWLQFSLGFLLPNTVVARGALTVSENVPLSDLGATVKFSGTLALDIKVVLRSSDAGDEASLAANAAAVILAGIVLAPLASWIAGAGTVTAARSLVQRTTAGLAGEWVLLGPSPTQ